MRPLYEVRGTSLTDSGTIIRQLDSAYARFGRHFAGAASTRLAVLIFHSPLEAHGKDTEQCSARELRMLPWILGAANPMPSERRYFSHEACHQLFVGLAAASRHQPAAAARTVALAYGSPYAPDWLDEAAATLCEDPAEKNRRLDYLRSRTNERISLSELFTMEHPEFGTMRALMSGVVADGTVRVVTAKLAPTDSARVLLFYAEAFSFARFVEAGSARRG